ncbi:MAG: stage II sporulation protein R [Ruminiclostridium sp.]|nr:stage II sporulation protein R [Ruminiclostridium sp.]
MCTLWIRVQNFPWRQVVSLFCAALVCTALWAEVQQGELADKIIRLHVIANSDSTADQALKLQVRDQVLLQAEDLLTGAESPQEAATILEDNLPVLAQTASLAARQAGHPCAVRVCLEETWFPTKQYGDLSLPAGEYQALRVILGDGQGKNWWCVVFPTLTMPAVTEESMAAGAFTGEEYALITEADQHYVFRFKALEWWGMCKGWLTDQD